MQLYRSNYPWLVSTENANTFGPPLIGSLNGELALTANSMGSEIYTVF